MSERFSKAAVIAYATERADAAAATFQKLTGNAIDPKNGTSQTWPTAWEPLARPEGDKNHLIKRAQEVADAFATWKAMQRLVGDINDGYVVK